VRGEIDRSPYIFLMGKMSHQSPLFYFRTIGMAVFVVALCSSASATVVDFNGIPDGTPAFSLNPYAGVLDLDAFGTTSYYSDSQYFTLREESSIIGGQLEILPPAVPDSIDPRTAYHSEAHVTVVFSQPVIGVSVDAFMYRTGAYFYSGFDANGVPFSGGQAVPGNVDNFPSPGFVTLSPFIPAGGYLASFSIDNQDPNRSGAEFLVDNVTFTVVPEPWATAMLGFGGILLLLCAGRQCRPGAVRLGPIRKQKKWQGDYARCDFGSDSASSGGLF
jgi:hypothetical protein